MSEKITFLELVDKIAVETGASKQLIHDLLVETANLTREGLSKDGFVNLPGIGRFRLKWHETRNGRNPQTGEEIEIPAHSTVNYKGESELRQYINRKYAHLKPEILEDEGIQADGPNIPEEEAAQPAQPEIIEEEISKPQEATDFFSKLEETPQSGSKDARSASQEGRRSLKYLWLILALLAVVLIVIFWPSSDKKEAKMPEEAPAAVVKTEEEARPQTKPAEPAPEKQAAKEAPAGIPGGEHKVTKGDNLWLVSQDFYGKGILWPNIYRNNTSSIKNPDLLVLGGLLQVPSLQGKLGELTQQDKEQIAEGFLEAYLNYKKRGKAKALFYLWVVKKWNMNTIIEKYKDQIDKKDLARVGNIDGHPRIN